MKCGCEYRNCPKCGVCYRCWVPGDKTGTVIEWFKMFCQLCGTELKSNSEQA